MDLLSRLYYHLGYTSSKDFNDLSHIERWNKFAENMIKKNGHTDTNIL